MKKLIIVCLAALPFTGMADITINAYAQDGAIAYLYDSGGTTYGTTTFSGGQAIISTAGLVGLGDYALAMSYAPGQAWYSNIAWANGAGGTQFKTLAAASSYTVKDAVTGAVTSRTLSGSTATVTLTANGMLSTYDNETNELDAQLGLYRPIVNDTELLDGSTISRKWDGTGLGGGYGYTSAPLAGSGLGLSLITITNTAGTFVAEYAGVDLGGESYDLYFLGLDKGTAYTDGTIATSGNDATFTVNGLGTGSYADQTPYYLLMDRAWIYDEDGNYSEAYDVGMVITDPDHYVIPEPAVLALVMGGGCALLACRRIFQI